MKRTVVTIIIAGLLLGGIFVMLEIIFQLPTELVWKYYMITSIVIIIGSVIYAVMRQMRFFKRLKELEKILREERNTDKFIQGNKELLQELKAKDQRTTVKINLAAGYCDKEDFEQAKEVLLSIDPNDLKGVHKIFYHINLAYTYFKLGENEKGIEIVDQYNNDFSKHENRPSLGSSIAIIRIFSLIEKNKLVQAKELLASSKEKWNDELLTKEWLFLENKIDALSKSN